MIKDRYSHLQVRERRLAIKRTLRDMHEGAFAPSRKEVFLSIGVSEATYSRWCNLEEDSCPDIFDIIAITKKTQNPVLIRCVLDMSCDGYEVVAAGKATSEPIRTCLEHLVRLLRADGDLHSGVAQDLTDEITPGRIDIDEARRRLPDAKEALKAHQDFVDHLESITRGRR